MNFFKSSFFADLKLQDVLASPQQDLPATSANSETLISSASREISSSDTEHLRDSGAQALLSSDADVLSGSGSHSPFSPRQVQEEQGAGIWSLGSLVKSIASKSEDIIQAYRKDLEEFGSGLKKETQLLAEVASHAVKDLPASLETGAFMAQESIESVGQAVEEISSSVWRGTADLIAQGKDAVLQIDSDESSAPACVATSSSSASRYDSVTVSVSGGKYSRFEAQVRAMQHDSSTYCDEPLDANDYNVWKSTFSLADKKEDVENLIVENTIIQELLRRFVPEVVSEDTFWTRYFYRLHKLQQTEEARADLVKRASALEEEDLSWDTEEEFEEAIHDEKYMSDRVHDSGKTSDNLEPAERLLTAGTNSSLGKAPQVGARCSPVSKSNSKPIVEEEEEDLGWEVPEDVDESSSNDGKRSSNSEASWEVPDVPKEEIKTSLLQR